MGRPARMGTHLVDQQLRRVVADTAQHPDDGPQEADVVHGLGQLDVAEVARTVHGIGPVRRADGAAVHGAHAQVGQAARLGPALLIGVAGVDLAHRVLFLRGGTSQAAGPRAGGVRMAHGANLLSSSPRPPAPPPCLPSPLTPRPAHNLIWVPDRELDARDALDWRRAVREAVYRAHWTCWTCRRSSTLLLLASPAASLLLLPGLQARRGPSPAPTGGALQRVICPVRLFSWSGQGWDVWVRSADVVCVRGRRDHATENYR